MNSRWCLVSKSRCLSNTMLPLFGRSILKKAASGCRWQVSSVMWLQVIGRGQKYADNSLMIDQWCNWSCLHLHQQLLQWRSQSSQPSATNTENTLYDSIILWYNKAVIYNVCTVSVYIKLILINRHHMTEKPVQWAEKTTRSLINIRQTEAGLKVEPDWSSGLGLTP